MEISFQIHDEECIQYITKLQQIYPNGSDFSKHMETILKVFNHFVKNSKWEFVDDSAQKLEERIQDQLRNSLTENTLNLQHQMQIQMVEQLTQIEERISRPMEMEFHKFQESIDQFRGASKNATTKGKLGEMNIERQIEWYFPESEIQDTRSEAEQADYHLTLEDTTLLLEVKTYSKNVPTKEIEKFVRDLTTKTHIQAGILVSSTSGIVKKPKFSYEVLASDNGPKLAVYVPNAIDQNSGNCVSVIWAILFILRVLQFQKQQKTFGTVTESSFEDSCEIIRHQMSWLEYLIEQNQSSLLSLEKCYRKSNAALEEWISESRKIWKNMDDILKQQVRLTKQFINEGKKELIPLPSGNDLVEVAAANVWKCCGKTYKTEKNYDKHVKEKHTSSPTTILSTPSLTTPSTHSSTTTTSTLVQTTII
jgi:hypothetical protein